jgi:hypothetical protein
MRPVRKVPRGNCRLLFADPLGCIVSSTVPAASLPFDNDMGELPGFPGYRRLVHVTALDAVSPLPFFNPCERLHPTSLRLNRARQLPRQHVD